MTPAARRARFDAYVAASDIPVAALALLVAPVLVLESHTDHMLGTSAPSAMHCGGRW
jgi:hypothetical protein